MSRHLNHFAKAKFAWTRLAAWRPTQKNGEGTDGEAVETRGEGDHRRVAACSGVVDERRDVGGDVGRPMACGDQRLERGLEAGG